jgi:hypothetical protein
MSNLILGKFALENLYYSTLPEGIDGMPSKRNLGCWKRDFNGSLMPSPMDNAARFPETRLKQVFPRTGSCRGRPKSLI